MARAYSLEIGETPAGDVCIMPRNWGATAPTWLVDELTRRGAETLGWARRENECKKVERQVCEVFPGAKVIERTINEPGRPGPE